MPAIRILTPRTNTVWSLGEMVTITWVSSGSRLLLLPRLLYTARHCVLRALYAGAMDQVRIKIATQFGIWQPIADCCENTGALLHYLPVTLPHYLTTSLPHYLLTTSLSACLTASLSVGVGTLFAEQCCVRRTVLMES